MADKKAPASSSENGHQLAFKIAGIVILGLIIFSALEKGPVGDVIDYAEDVTTVEETEDLTATDFIPSEGFKLGETVANKAKTIVRSAPGGQIIGLQKGAEKGKAVEGPVFAFDKNWWRVDYKKSPDGWVEGKDLSSNLFIFSLINFFPNLYANIKGILILIGIIIFVLVIIYSSKTREVLKIKKQKREIEKPAIYKKTPEPILKVQEDVGLPIPNLPVADSAGIAGLKFETQENKRWKNIEYLIATHNSNDWRQAIIEADVILEEMLDRMGFEGDSVGEKLKQIEQSDFVTLNYAWEAHKVRNRIAHAGSGFQMSKDEAVRVIDLYRKVFEEFYYI